MITRIREVRREKGLTLQDVADRCEPPTTAQTIGRLETGTRTVSVSWIVRIAAALGVTSSDLVTLAEQVDLPVVSLLGPDGASAPQRVTSIVAPRPAAGQVAIIVTGSTGDYRTGDEIWCDRIAPEAIATALNRDVLVPRPAGHLIFGRLVAHVGDTLQMLPHDPGSRLQTIVDPPWAAVAVRLVRAL